MQWHMLWDTLNRGLFSVCFNRHDRWYKRMEKTCIIYSKVSNNLQYCPHQNFVSDGQKDRQMISNATVAEELRLLITYRADLNLI